MTYSWWDALKDLLGAAGPILIAVPWLRDFWLRHRKSRVEEVSATGRLGKLKISIEDSMRRKIESPKMADFVWTILGLLLIFASFVIAFIRGLLFEVQSQKKGPKVKVDPDNEYMACEVKKTVSELDELIELMQRFSTDRDAVDTLKSSKETNAFRKLKGLRARRASIFWAVGPGGANYVFRMSYTDQGAVIFKPASDDTLTYTAA